MIEFDCVECGQHIIRFNGEPGEPQLCGHCLHIPGWFRHPEVRRMLAPEGLPDLPENEKEEGA